MRKSCQKEKNLDDAQKAFDKAFSNYTKQKSKVDRMKPGYLIGKSAQKDPFGHKINAEIDKLQSLSDIATEKYNELEKAKKPLEQICNLKHGVSGITDVIYYACYPDTSKCHLRSKHWVPCRGGCDELFPPPTTHHSVGGSFYYNWKEFHDHETVCKESVYNFWNPWAKCGKKFFTCQGGCPHKSDEGIFYNKTGFKVYETIAVRVKKDDLYMATMSIDGNIVSTAYQGSGGEAVLRKTFDSDDSGKNYTVKISVYYGDINSPSYSTHTSSISVD